MRRKQCACCFNDACSSGAPQALPDGVPFAGGAVIRPLPPAHHSSPLARAARPASCIDLRGEALLYSARLAATASAISRMLVVRLLAYLLKSCLWSFSHSVFPSGSLTVTLRAAVGLERARKRQGDTGYRGWAHTQVRGGAPRGAAAARLAEGGACVT